MSYYSTVKKWFDTSSTNLRPYTVVARVHRIHKQRVSFMFLCVYGPVVVFIGAANISRARATIVDGTRIAKPGPEVTQD